MNFCNKTLLAICLLIFFRASIATESSPDFVYVADGDYTAKTYTSPLYELQISDKQFSDRLHKKLLSLVVCSSGSVTANWIIENGALFITKVSPLCVNEPKEFPLIDLFPDLVELNQGTENSLTKVKAVWFSGDLLLETKAPHFKGPCGFRQSCPESYDWWVFKNGEVVSHELRESRFFEQYKACGKPPFVEYVPFKSGSAVLSKTAKSILNGSLERIHGFEELQYISVVGSGDTVTSSRNISTQQRLAESRAAVINKYFIDNGVSVEKIRVYSEINHEDKLGKAFIFIDGKCRFK